LQAALAAVEARFDEVLANGTERALDG